MSTTGDECKVQTVCVTGGTGFLGSWCVAVLLARGYKVRATMRTPSKADFLKALPGAIERLELFQADLMAPGSFDKAVDGCEAVLHTASPFFVQGGTEEALVVPALKGTENVLTSCHKYNVKRVALTSSTASVYANFGTQPESKVWTKDDWSDTELLRSKGIWYTLSKTLAERRAWEMSRVEGCPYKLTVLNPTLIYGPQLDGQKHLNTSCADLMPFMDGSTKEVRNMCKAIVDVRDVAEAHVLAIESDKGVGQRFVLIAACPHTSEVMGYIQKALPDELKGNVPSKLSEEIGPCTIGAPPPHPTLYDASPSEKILGLKYRSAEEQVTSMIRSMVQNGFHSNQQYAHKVAK